jgi:hypothetical protein
MDLTNRNAIPFFYTVSVTIAALNGTAQSTLILQSDSYFELHSILATGGATAATEGSTVNPNNFSVSIRDQTTGRDLTQGRIPQRLLAGNAFNAFQVIRRPIVFEPQSNLFFDFLDLTGVANNAITLVLAGVKQIIG